MMKYITEYNTYSDIESICEKYGIENYIINKDGSIDVAGDVYLGRRSLQKIPLNFNKVTGYFACDSNKLTSLEGCPEEVGGIFYCSNCQLSSLEGCPKKVGGDFNCQYNRLTSLEGSPSKVTGSFHCFNNQLTLLEGCPKEVGGDFNCGHNRITSLEGCPKEIGGYFYCDHNRLTSLEGCLKEIGGYFKFHSNLLPRLIMDNYKYIDGIIKWQDDYSIWRKDGSLDEFRFKDMMIDIKNDYDLK